MKGISLVTRILLVTAALLGSVLWVSVSADNMPPLIGPGPNGGAPEGPSFTPNPITYWLVGILVAAPAIYGAYRIRKRRMAERK